MFELFVASDVARRLTEDSLEFSDNATRKTRKRVRRRGLRSVSAAMLRGLAERLEPSPSRSRGWLDDNSRARTR